MSDFIGPYPLGPNDTEENGIYIGDARELAKMIPVASVDLIFTDPVYNRIDDYQWLAQIAARILKNGGNVIAQAGTEYRFEAEMAMRSIGCLLPRPLLAEVYAGAGWQMFKHRTMTGWKPYIWLSKGQRSGKWVFDRMTGGGCSKGQHRWGDSVTFFLEYISRLTEYDNVIFDPFTGSGTVPVVCKMLNRRYIAFEIDPGTAEMARKCVYNAQPPLFVPEPHQLKLEVD